MESGREKCEIMCADDPINREMGFLIRCENIDYHHTITVDNVAKARRTLSEFDEKVFNKLKTKNGRTELASDFKTGVIDILIVESI